MKNTTISRSATKIPLNIKAITLIMFMGVLGIYSAQAQQPTQIEVEKLKWISPPPVPGLEFTWVKGSEQEHSVYAIRVKLESGTKIPPHTHPDQRLSTVLSGTLYVGFGDVFDASKLVAIEQGNAYIAPAKMPHFIWAKDGGVSYQETGVGPTATEIIGQ